jgi:hypothetical protein
MATAGHQDEGLRLVHRLRGHGCGSGRFVAAPGLCYPARQTYPRGLRNDYGMTVICTLEPLWSALQGVGAIGVAVIAALGLVAAFRQINEVRASRTEAANIARTQRTTELLAEFGTDDMEYSFGFFDAAYGVADSREIFNAIYDDFVVSTRRRLRGMERTERLAAVRKESIAYLDYELDPDGDSSKIKRADRATACKNEIITTANLCERAWVLVERGAVDADLFLADQAYNIASTYFIAQDALADLCREEHFNFDDFREIALRARDSLKSKPYATDLVDQPFPPLPQYNPTQ